MPLGRGKLEKKVFVTEVRPMTREDLELIREKRTASPVQRFRDPHHRLARLIAGGLRIKDAAQACGYSLPRAYTLTSDPAFQELVARYRADVHEAFVSSEQEGYSLAQEVNRKALRHIAEHFDKADEEGELIPLNRALSVFADTSDRVGIAKKSTQVNINMDFATKLEDAIKRSGKVIDVTPSPPSATKDLPNSAPVAEAAPSNSPLIRRRA